MSATMLETVPSVEVTKDGTTYYFPIQTSADRNGALRAMPIVRTPKLAFPPPLVITGPTGGQFRRNYDIDEVVITDWSSGMGEETYPPNEEVRSYQYGQCDSRWPNVLVSRPLAVQLGSNTASMDLTTARVIELNYTNATLLWYAVDYGPSASPNNNAYRYTGSAWTKIQHSGVDIANVRSHAVGMSGVIIEGDTGGGAGQRAYRSTDGVTWVRTASAGAGSMVLCMFDSRVWVVGFLSSGLTKYSTDFWTAAADSNTWTSGATVGLATGEYPNKLFVWTDPQGSGRPTLWLMTNCRLLSYDYYAATPSWQEFFMFQTPQEAAAYSPTYMKGGDAVVSPRDGNLYATVYGREWIWEFTGSAVLRHSWNKRHGMTSGTRLTPYTLAANESGLYLFCGGHPGDSASKGAALFMDDAKNFHPLYDQATNEVYGGGVGTHDLWVVTPSTTNGQVWHLENPDVLSVPPRVTGRTFDSADNITYSAWIHCNLKNVNKRLLYFEVDCLKADETKGLDSGATVKIAYRGRGSASWTTTTTITDASTFPNVIEVTGGWSFKEMQVRITLTRGSATSATPILRALKIGFRVRPKQRYTYAVPIDLRDDAPAFQTADGLYRGYTASKLRGILDELGDNDDSGADDTLVGLAYGGNGNSTHPRRRSVAQCEVLVQAQEGAQSGDGRYMLMFNDVSAPSSG